VQVDPIKPTLKAPGSKRLILKHDRLVLDLGFNFNLRRCTEASKSAKYSESGIDTGGDAKAASSKSSKTSKAKDTGPGAAAASEAGDKEASSSTEKQTEQHTKKEKEKVKPSIDLKPTPKHGHGHAADEVKQHSQDVSRSVSKDDSKSASKDESKSKEVSTAGSASGAAPRGRVVRAVIGLRHVGMGLHSSTFRLNVSTLCGTRWVHDFSPVC
jgi:hypothetical protein